MRPRFSPDVPLAASAASESPYRKRVVGVLSLSHLADDLNQGAIPAILPFLIAQQHLSYARASTLVLGASLLSSFVQPAFGLLSDRRPSSWYVAVGLGLAGTGVALVGIASSFGWMFACMLVSGFGIAMFHPEAARLVIYAAGPRRATAMSVFGLGGNLGFAIGPLVTTQFLLLLGVRGALLLCVPALAMAGLLAWRVPRWGLVPPKAAARAQAGEGPQNDWRAFTLLTGGVMARSIFFFGLNTFLPLYWIATLGQSTAAGANALTVFLLACAGGTLLGGRLGDVFDRRRVALGAFAVNVPLLLLFLFAHSPGWALLLLVPLGIANATPFSVLVVLGQEALPRALGVASGITLGLAVSVGGLVAPLLGRVADRSGIGHALLTLVAVPFLGIVSLLAIRSHRTSPEHAPR